MEFAYKEYFFGFAIEESQKPNPKISEIK